MWLNVAFKAIFYHFSSQSIKFSNLKVWHEMEAKLVGEFTEDQSEREKSFQAKMTRFQSVCRDLISAHKTAREGGDYEQAPFLNALIDSAEDEEEEFADCVAFVVGGFHTTGNVLTWYDAFELTPETKFIIVFSGCSTTCASTPMSRRRSVLRWRGSWKGGGRSSTGKT